MNNGIYCCFNQNLYKLFIHFGEVLVYIFTHSGIERRGYAFIKDPHKRTGVFVTQVVFCSGSYSRRMKVTEAYR